MKKTGLPKLDNSRYDTIETNFKTKSQILKNQLATEKNNEDATKSTIIERTKVDPKNMSI